MGVTVLLDTHALLWALLSPRELSGKARRLLSDRSNTLLVSPASAWEIATKSRIGKLNDARDVVANYDAHLRTLGAIDTPITTAQALLAGGFNVDHRDPFDRMIAAQATLLGVPVVTRDPAFALFPCQQVW
jgi:PIN domain nuclease of toxin-antitoxin system